jgi:hypothetical protein
MGVAAPDEPITHPDIAHLCINTICTLSMDAVQQAKFRSSGNTDGARTGVFDLAHPLT